MNAFLQPLSWHQFLTALNTRPGMYLPSTNYDSVVCAILGFAYACEDGVLDGFIEQLSKDEPYGNWIFSSLIAAEALGIRPPDVPKNLDPEKDLLCRQALLGQMLAFVGEA